MYSFLTLPNLLPPLPSEPTRILKQPEYKVVQRGRSVVFECKVKHDPTLIPTMTWLKDDGELPDDERSELLFTIGNVSLSRPLTLFLLSFCIRCKGSSQYLFTPLA